MALQLQSSFLELGRAHNFQSSSPTIGIERGRSVRHGLRRCLVARYKGYLKGMGDCNYIAAYYRVSSAQMDDGTDATAIPPSTSHNHRV